MDIRVLGHKHGICLTRTALSQYPAETLRKTMGLQVSSVPVGIKESEMWTAARALTSSTGLGMRWDVGTSNCQIKRKLVEEDENRKGKT